MLSNDNVLALRAALKRLFGKLGQYFGLPIPDIELVYVDDSLLEYNDYDLLQNYEQRIKTAMTKWDDLVTVIPDDWKEGLADFDGFMEQIKLILNEYQNKQFWEGLK